MLCALIELCLAQATWLPEPLFVNRDTRNTFIFSLTLFSRQTAIVFCHTSVLRLIKNPDSATYINKKPSLIYSILFPLS